MPAGADTTDDLRDLLRALAMPFQLAPLLFVAMSSVLLGLFLGGGLITLVICMLAIFLLLGWLTHYALALIDDAANGVRESQAASVEMAGFFEDARAWVHPALAVATIVLLLLNPDWPRLPALAGAALFLPASLGATALSGRALDAFNPVEMARVMRGLGIWYPAVVLFMLACIVIALAATRLLGSLMLSIAAIQILLLLSYAAIGGVLYMRRQELDFEPRRSPERIADNQEHERIATRQRFIDSLYKDLRVRESARAQIAAARWLRDTEARHLHGDMAAILAAGTHWNESREYARLLRGLLPVLLDLRQPGLALQAAEAGIAQASEFCAETEPHTIDLVSYALQTGRRRAAARLLENYLQRAGDAAPGPHLLALRERLQAGGSTG